MKLNNGDRIISRFQFSGDLCSTWTFENGYFKNEAGGSWHGRCVTLEDFMKDANTRMFSWELKPGSDKWDKLRERMLNA